jgi:hypothetical protein
MYINLLVGEFLKRTTACAACRLAIFLQAQHWSQQLANVFDLHQF